MLKWRIFAGLLMLLLLLPLFTACAPHPRQSPAIVCTIYPIYDWVLQILGETADVYPVKLLSDNGNDPHNYQPTVGDLSFVADAALFLYVGGVSDDWAKEIAKPQGRVLALIDAVEICTAEHDHGAHGEHDGHDHSEIDEHFWLSLRNAQKAVAAITETLCAVYAADSASCATFRRNAAAYTDMLASLDKRYRDVVAAAPRDGILVADRFPFAYLTMEYGLYHHAAFPGCSAETEASVATVLSLIDAVKRDQVRVILITETGTAELANTVIASSGKDGIEVLVLHSCQSVSKRERENGTTYLSIMEENLAVLIRALAA